MFENEVQPYSKEEDAKIPVGTVMPGVLIAGSYEGDRGDLVGGSRWKDGYWTLEVTRKMKTGSKYDKDFVAGKNLYMWVRPTITCRPGHTPPSAPRAHRHAGIVFGSVRSSSPRSCNR
jgi:hypothetical protein